MALRANDFQWSSTRISQLKRLAAKGIGARAIATEFGVTRNAVLGAAKRNGISVKGAPAKSTGKPRLFTAEETKTAVALYRQDFSFANIAGVLCCGKEQITRHLKELVKAGRLNPRENRNKPLVFQAKPRFESVPPAPGRGKPFLELRLRDCRMPTFQGRPPLDQRTFCAEPAVDGSSFCASCHSLVYRAREAA